jgi:hypothetical protein
MENKKQTAVQWYADKQESLQGIFSLGGITATEYYEKMTELVKAAMQLEKEQITDAFSSGEDNIDANGGLIIKNGSEQYYNKTY